MRLGVIGLDVEGPAVAGNGLIQLSQVLERIAEVAMRICVIGLDGEGLVVAGNGLIQPPQVLERIA